MPCLYLPMNSNCLLFDPKIDAADDSWPSPHIARPLSYARTIRHQTASLAGRSYWTTNLEKTCWSIDLPSTSRRGHRPQIPENVDRPRHRDKANLSQFDWRYRGSFLRAHYHHQQR